MKLNNLCIALISKNIEGDIEVKVPKRRLEASGD